MDKLVFPSDEADVDKPLEKCFISELTLEGPINSPPKDLLLDNVVKLDEDSAFLTEVTDFSRPAPPPPPLPPPLLPVK